jgi:hypothetical protein
MGVRFQSSVREYPIFRASFIKSHHIYNDILLQIFNINSSPGEAWICCVYGIGINLQVIEKFSCLHFK